MPQTASFVFGFVVIKASIPFTLLSPDENGAPASNKKPKANKKAHVAPRRARQGHVGPQSHGGQESAHKAEAAKLAPRWYPELALVSEREKQRGNRNRATLAVARKLTAYLLAVDREGARATRAPSERDPLNTALQSGRQL